MAPHRDGASDEELEALVEEFSDRRVYRPTGDAAEPEEPPRAGSGTAKADADPAAEPSSG
ncbi:hypothetical protein [Streptomyces sp. NPDC001903]|uniref:hypothetical protein n=1 Tax=Streptomyces sp. NPDC001903 TaxID=3364622 RepID=UPI0036B7154B